MYPYQETAIRQQFGCRILKYYVSEESVFLAAECASHGSMHIDMRKGIMEIVDESGDILPEGAPGRIICTGFNNSIMPLIRYDTGDTGTISPEACLCGRGLTVLQSLDGRTSEIMRFGNRFIFPASLSVIIDDIENLLECQFIQESETKLTVNIVPGRSYEEKDSDSIKHKLAELVGDDVSIRLSFSDNIPRTPLGKFQFVITRSPESRD